MPLSGEYVPSTSQWVRDQVALYENSGGTRGTTIMGRPVVILTTIGAKSGGLRKTGLMRIEHEGVYAIVGSNGGAEKDPGWVHNVEMHPHVELQDGPSKHDYMARKASGTERDQWWRRAVDAWPDMETYQSNTSRELPIFVLDVWSPANS